MKNDDHNISEELISKTIKSDEEYYGQEDIIWRSVRGVGEMFRHLGDPHFKNAWTFLLAFIFNLFLISQALLVLVFTYYYILTFTYSYLIEFPIFLFVLLEALFVVVISLKIIIGTSKFLMKKNVVYSFAYILSMILLVVLLALFFNNVILVLSITL